MRRLNPIWCAWPQKAGNKITRRKKRFASIRSTRRIPWYVSAVLPRCALVAVIAQPQQARKILRHLIKTGKASPGLDPASRDGTLSPLTSQESVCPFSPPNSEQSGFTMRPTFPLPRLLSAPLIHPALGPGFHPGHPPAVQSLCLQGTSTGKLTALQLYNAGYQPADAEDPGSGPRQLRVRQPFVPTPAWTRCRRSRRSGPSPRGIRPAKRRSPESSRRV